MWYPWDSIILALLGSSNFTKSFALANLWLAVVFFVVHALLYHVTTYNLSELPVPDIVALERSIHHATVVIHHGCKRKAAFRGHRKVLS